jgi:FkbM family methyltransferase
MQPNHHFMQKESHGAAAASRLARLLIQRAKPLVPMQVLRLARYVRHFGPSSGPVMFRQAYLAPDGTVVGLAVPGLAHPVYIRARGSDVSAFGQVFIEREYAMRVDPAPKLIIDAGANIGLSTVWFAAAYPNARVIAIEPDRGNFELLQRNVAPYPNVIALRKALWCSEARLKIVNPSEASWSFEVQECADGDIEATTLAAVVRLAGLHAAEIVKLDIEGSEREVLSDPPAWLDQVSVLFCELHERKRAGCERAFDAFAGRTGLARKTMGEKQVLYRSELAL